MSDLEIETQVYTVQQAGRILGLSRAAAYKAIASGQLPSVRFGERMLRVSKVAIERLLSSETAT